MKKILFVFFLALALVACKKDDDNNNDKPTGSFEFNNGNDGELAMTIGTKATVSFTNKVTPSKVTIESSDEDVVYFSPEDGALVAKGIGEAIVTATLKADETQSATLHVTVSSYINNASFYSIQYWGGDGEWDMKKYTMFRIHSKPQGSNAVVDLSHVGDTANIAEWIDDFEQGKWYYLYDSEVTGDSVGLFMDSIYSLKTYMMAKECLFDGSSISLAGDHGLVLCYEDHFMFDSKYWYCLGDRVFVDDVTAVGKQYTQTGKEKVPYPGAVQVGHFNEKNYVTYWGGLLSDEEPEAEDYPYFNTHDCYFIMFFMYNDETSETGRSMGGLESGYPILPEVETELDFYVDQDANNDQFAAYYYINAMMFPQVDYNYGLKTEVDEDGVENWVYPFELDPMVNVVYEGGQVPADKPARIKGVNGKRSELPMPRKAMEKKMSFDRTLAATIRMILSK